MAEITSGRACAQQRLAASCKDHPCKAMPKTDGGQQVWRMSPYERRRRGNALPGGRACLLRGGNTGTKQRGSGHLAAPGWPSDTVPRQRSAHEAGDELLSKPAIGGVHACQGLSLAASGKAHQGKPRSEPDWGNPAVRDRRGACGNVDRMGAGMRPSGKPLDKPPDPAMLRATGGRQLSWPPGDNYPGRWEGGDLLMVRVSGLSVP